MVIVDGGKKYGRKKIEKGILSRKNAQYSVDVFAREATRARNAAGARRNSGDVAPSIEVNFNQDSIDLKGLNEPAEIIF